MRTHDLFSLDEMLLYRGDAEAVAMFDVGVTDPGALFGPGIYLTSDPVVAHDYTVVRGAERVYPQGRDGGVARSVKQLLKNYVSWRASQFDEKAFKDQWVRQNGHGSSYTGLPTHVHRDLDNAIAAAQRQSAWDRLPAAQAQVRAELPGLKALRKSTGEYVLVRKARQAAVSSFNIPDDYLARTLHGDRPLPDDALAAIRALWLKTYPGDNADLRDHRENMIGFDAYVQSYKRHGTRRSWADDDDPPIGGKGANPSLDDLRNGTNSGYYAFVDGTFDQGRPRSHALIAALQQLGYVGVEYDGGKRMGGYVRGGGGRLHRAFVFWNAADLAKFRADNQPLPSLRGMTPRSLPTF